MDEELKKSRAYLDMATNQKIIARGTILATAEKVYRIALAEKIHALRNDKIQIAIINDLAKGDPEVAELRHSRDVPRAKYESLLAGIKAHETIVNSLEVTR